VEALHRAPDQGAGASSIPIAIQFAVDAVVQRWVVVAEPGAVATLSY